MKSIILAGGSGSRLWPLSREEYPKQFLSLDKNESLLQETFNRTCHFANPSDIVTVTNVKQYTNIKLQLNNIDKNNIVIGEPLVKNTAPAIASAIEYFIQTQSDENDIVLILPSDHIIKDITSFKNAIEQAYMIAKDGYIVTLGVRPDYPETAYGYIKTGDAISCGYKVDKFVEKPDSQDAQQYFSTGDYYWNSGIFIGKISVFVEAYKKYMPQIIDNIKNIDYSQGTQINYTVYETMPNISIDYAIMEKADNIALVELKSDWKDVGSWKSIYDVKDKDENGNVLTGKVIIDNVKNSFIYSQKEIVAVSGLENIILVETEDAIMACDINDSQNVKNLYEKLKTTESGITKLHKTVFRPWGYYTCMNGGEGYLTKTICVLPKHKLSVQSHNHRSEHWVVLEGKALVLLEGKEYDVNAGDSIDIPLGAKHSLQNPYDEELKIIEVQKGDYISEDDIIRYEDCYGRV